MQMRPRFFFLRPGNRDALIRRLSFWRLEVFAPFFLFRAFTMGTGTIVLRDKTSVFFLSSLR